MHSPTSYQLLNLFHFSDTLQMSVILVKKNYTEHVIKHPTGCLLRKIACDTKEAISEVSRLLSKSKMHLHANNFIS